MNCREAVGSVVAWSNIGFDKLYAKTAPLQHLRQVCEPDRWGFESPEVLAGDWAKMLPSLRKSVRLGVNTRPSITTGTVNRQQLKQCPFSQLSWPLQSVHIVQAGDATIRSAKLLALNTFTLDFAMLQVLTL